jgi:hypothetical protein
MPFSVRPTVREQVCLKLKKCVNGEARSASLHALTVVTREKAPRLCKDDRKIDRLTTNDVKKTGQISELLQLFNSVKYVHILWTLTGVSLGAFCSKEEAEVTTSRTHRGENGNGLN